MEEQNKIELKKLPGASSTLMGYHYDAETKTLYLGFSNFKKGMVTYQYNGVPEQIVYEFLSADSHGTYFHASIKDNYETIKL